MNPKFEELWRRTVGEEIAKAREAWNEHGGKWLAELSGDSLTDLATQDMSNYNDFSTLSAEEQYAFICWYKQKGYSLAKYFKT